MNAKIITINVGVLILGITVGALINQAFRPKPEETTIEIIRNYNSSAKNTAEQSATSEEAPSENALAKLYANGPQGNVLSKYAAMILKYDGLTQEEFMAEADALSELKGSDRLLAQFLLFSAWGENYPEDAMAYLAESDSLRGRDEMMAKRAVYDSWSHEDPATAAAYLLEAGDNEMRMRGMNRTSNLSMIAERWAEQDPVAAFEWINSLDQNDKEEALADYMRSLYSSNPELALEQLNSLSSEDQAEAIKGLASVWGRELDWEEVTDSISELPEDLQDEAFFSAIQPFARENPYEAVDLIIQTENSPDKNRAVATIAMEISNEDPAYALDLAMNHMDDQQGRVIATVLGPWLRSDTTAAVTWINEQPPSKTLDHMVEMMGNSPHLDQEIKDQLKK